MGLADQEALDCTGSEPAPKHVAPRVRHPRGEGEAIDTPRAFLGDEATWYDERWRWMEWRGIRTSWNTAAALGFGFWLAFRKMYRLAALQILWIGFLTLWLRDGGSWGAILVLHGVVAVLLGRYGNWLYYQHFIHTAQRIYRRVFDAEGRERGLTQAGGTSPTAAVALGVLSAGTAALVWMIDSPFGAG